MTMYAIRYSNNSYGPLVPRETAERAFEGIAEDRKAFCTLTCWREVTDANAETLPPPPIEPEPIDLHCKHCGQDLRSHGYCGTFRPCHEAYRKSYEPINPGPRKPAVTLPDLTLEQRDVAHNRRLVGKAREG